MRWTWALLLLAAGARGAETRFVIEDFATTTGLWTDTGEVLGLPESVQPPVGTIQLTTEGETLRVDYDVASRRCIPGPVSNDDDLTARAVQKCRCGARAIYKLIHNHR